MGSHRNTLIAVGVLGLALALFHDNLPSFNLEQVLEDLSGSLGNWTYLLVGGLAFLETGAFVGLIAPGEFTVMLGGAVAGQGDISLPLIIAVTWFCAWAGDTVSFFAGQRLGRGFLVTHGPRVGINEERLTQVEGYFRRHGGKTILIGRFIGLVRALAPFIAGTSRMRYSAFVPYSVLGTGLWATGLVLAGYFASQSLDKVAEIVGRGFVLFGVTVGIIVAIVLVVRFLRQPENRKKIVDAIEKRPWLRPLLAWGRRVRPQAQFVWNRLTPGGLGLELTTLLAIFAVGLFVVISYASIVSGDPGGTPGDGTAMRWAQDIQVEWLTDLAKAVTELGSAYVVLPLALIAAAVLASMRRWAELCVLVGGCLIIFIGPGLIKEATDRPRPPGGLVGAEGSSFPSAHAAHATLYAWLAVTLALRIAPGLQSRTALILSGILLTALVGLTRVYLGVHYMSDVSAGWGLGLAGFAVLASIALIVGHFRKNGPPNEDPDGRPRLGH